MSGTPTQPDYVARAAEALKLAVDAALNRMGEPLQQQMNAVVEALQAQARQIAADAPVPTVEATDTASVTLADHVLIVRPDGPKLATVAQLLAVKA